MTGNNYINLIDSSTLVFPDYNYPPVFTPPTSPPEYDIKTEFTVSDELTVNGKIRTFSFVGKLGRITKAGEELTFNTNILIDELHIKDGILYTDKNYTTKYVILPFAATTNERTDTIEVYNNYYYIPIVPETYTELDTVNPILCILFYYGSVRDYTYDYNITTNRLSNKSTNINTYTILSISKQIHDYTEIYITKSTKIFDKTTNILTPVMIVPDNSVPQSPT